MIYYGHELYHHGIAGQKWGVKNGPPYPLKSSDHSSAEKKNSGGWRSSVKATVKNKVTSAIKNSGKGNVSSKSTGVKSVSKLGSSSDKVPALPSKSATSVKANKYRNSDGTLTDKGKERYERDQRENAAKKKENRIDVSEPDPDRWETEDLQRTKNVVDTSNKIVKQTETAVDNIDVDTERMDLSDMSDAQLREAINRENLELQYNKLFNTENETAVKKGKEITLQVLEVAGSILGVTSSAIGLALAIKQLRGG